MIILSILGLIFLLFTSLQLSSIISSSKIFLTSTPSPLDRAYICQGVNVQLYCELSDINASTFHWFLCENETCVVYALAIPVIDGSGSVIVDDPIAGLKITIDPAVQTAERRLSVISIMSLNVSIYNSERIRTFRCGRDNHPESNNVTIDFKHLRAVPPTPMNLIAVYDSFYKLSELRVLWRQVRTCYFEYKYEVDLITGTKTQRQGVTDEACNWSTEVCSYKFEQQILNEALSASDTLYSVRLLTRESYNNLTHTYDFLDTVSISIQNRFTFSFRFSLCKFQINCIEGPIIYNSSHCTALYTGIFDNGTVDTSTTANAIVRIPLFPAYTYQALVKVGDLLLLQTNGSVDTTEVFSCGKAELIVPEFGYLTVGSTRFGSVASYACDSEYSLVGNPNRICTLFGWSGTHPVCANNTDPDISARIGSNDVTHTHSFMLLLIFVSVSLKLSSVSL